MAAVFSGSRRRRAEWQCLIERAHRSPLSVRAFCAAEGVSTASFYLWRKRFGMEAREERPVAATAAFLDLGELDADAAAGCESSAWDLELSLGGGVVLRLRRR